jgi:hypothetical protein
MNRTQTEHIGRGTHCYHSGMRLGHHGASGTARNRQVSSWFLEKERERSNAGQAPKLQGSGSRPRSRWARAGADAERGGRRLVARKRGIDGTSSLKSRMVGPGRRTWKLASNLISARGSSSTKPTLPR